MENIQFKIELGVPAQRIIQQLQLNHKLIEEQIEKGVTEALTELAENNNLVKIVKQKTKEEVINIVHKAVLSYDLQNQIQKVIAGKIQSKIESYADSVVEKLNLNL